MNSLNCVGGTRTQPLICVGCSVHYWVSCAINKGGFFEIAFVVVDTIEDVSINNEYEYENDFKPYS